MDFESKITSREVSEILWESEKTVGTAESCTGGRIAEAMIAVPGASKYFKGGIISYVNEIKESLLGVDHQVSRDGIVLERCDGHRNRLDATDIGIAHDERLGGIESIFSVNGHVLHIVHVGFLVLRLDAEGRGDVDIV